MAESSSSGDEEFRGEAKYKQFSAAVERALKGFELSSEWHDLISSLARLNKVRTCTCVASARLIDHPKSGYLHVHVSVYSVYCGYIT